MSEADSAHVRLLRQQVGPGMAGAAWNAGDPKTTIGDSRWANYTVSADVQFEATASGQYATIGAREQGGTANGQSVSAAELKVDPTGAWTLMRFGATVASGTVAGNADVSTGSGALRLGEIDGSVTAKNSNGDTRIDGATGEVRVRAEVRKAFVRFSVEDDGPGFAPDILSRLGEPYVSSRSVHAEHPQSLDGSGHGGMGLGLFIAKTLCEHTGAVVGFGNRDHGGAYVRALWRRDRVDILLADDPTE